MTSGPATALAAPSGGLAGHLPRRIVYVPAVRDGHLYEVKSAEILQPGPAALSDGVRSLSAIFQGWARDLS